MGLELIAPVIVLKSSSGYRSILEGKYCVRIFCTKWNSTCCMMELCLALGDSWEELHRLGGCRAVIPECKGLPLSRRPALWRVCTLGPWGTRQVLGPVPWWAGGWASLVLVLAPNAASLGSADFMCRVWSSVLSTLPDTWSVSAAQLHCPSEKAAVDSESWMGIAMF